MRIDPKDLIPLPPLDQFQVGGHFYHLRSEGDYERVQFEKKDFEDRHARALIVWWMETEKHKLFLNRNAPWKSFLK